MSEFLRIFLAAFCGFLTYDIVKNVVKWIWVKWQETDEILSNLT